MKAALITIPGLFLGESLTRLAASDSSRLSVEVYIWKQLLSRQHRTLTEGLGDIFSTAKAAGFQNIELDDDFFTPDLSARTLSLLQTNRLSTPSVYVHGAMHELVAGGETEQRALSVFAVAKQAGCKAIVCDPEPKPAGEKTGQELVTQAMLADQLGRKLAAAGANLRLHNHKVELQSGAREWRYMLKHTDPKFVSVCLDIDWVKQAGYEPLDLLREAGSRVSEIHIRSSNNLVWQESVAGGGDVDYGPIAVFLKRKHLEPLVVVELAYADGTTISRSLEEDLRRSRVFAERTFDLSA
jgi:sugar phosphate isomerase/epimerase